jgi:23S rRNA (adenine2030-N6)-methyltransferase
VANTHFGNVGDVWKHLAYAEIIAIERPQDVWESHAGSALYSLSHSPERDFGVYYFCEHASMSATLANSEYARILRELETGGELHVYPGSPFLAMRLLKWGSTEFVFCDKDKMSLADIKDAASHLSIAEARLRLSHGDGLSPVSQLGAELPTAEAASTVVHIDPYQPWRASSPGLNSFDLLCQLGDRGVTCMLWAGYHTAKDRKGLSQALKRATTNAGTSAERLALWSSDFRLADMTDGRLSANAGVINSLVIGSHLSERSRAACDELGYELARIYGSAQLADGHDAAMEYTSF